MLLLILKFEKPFYFILTEFKVICSSKCGTANGLIYSHGTH